MSKVTDDVIAGLIRLWAEHPELDNVEVFERAGFEVFSGDFAVEPEEDAPDELNFESEMSTLVRGLIVRI